MSIEQAAEKEMKRMIEVFDSLESKDDKNAEEFYSFAKNYFEDGKYFFENKKYIESFEAFIISWAYIDAGMKLKFFKVQDNIKKYFTVDK